MDHQINRGYAEWEKSVHDFLLVEDKYIVKAIPVLLLTHRLTGDPVWTFIIAPSASGKTEFIKAMEGLNGVHPISSLTSKTLISGAKMAGGVSASLLTQVKNGYFTFEDFTTIASEGDDETKAIFGQLRAIYGGKFDKQFGTGETVSWEGKITLIAGATHAIHRTRQLFSNMGERFLCYNLDTPDREKASYRTMINHGGDIQTMRKNMNDTLKNLMDIELLNKAPSEMPQITDEFRMNIVKVAEFVTRARSTVERDMRSPQKEIVEVYPPEMPTRFAAQMQKISEATMVLNHYIHGGQSEMREEDFQMLYKFCFDSIPGKKRKVLQICAQYDVVDTAAVALQMNMPTNTVRRWLEDYNALEILDRTKGGGNKGDKWSIKHEYRDTIQKFEHVDVKGGEYTESQAYEDTGLLTADEVEQQKILDDFDR